MNNGFPPQSYTPQLLQSMHHSVERPSQSNQGQHVPLGHPSLISQPNVPVASGTFLPEPYLRTSDINMNGGPRALFSYQVRSKGIFAVIFTEYLEFLTLWTNRVPHLSNI